MKIKNIFVLSITFKYNKLLILKLFSELQYEGYLFNNKKKKKAFS